ncbi:restriction endonuclease subunit S [Kocuria rhizophila]|uniref:Type I restriction enzyme S protein n=1 Tax=Kocuria rhizophila (strain ATCC 9341 / DSM 348 / NBRC 103217 / DC2201) TaxID=378753 RepID=B2GHN2_KOCRD|nr:restriction endonuclease subunit S [Kocuria rhizophila]ASE11155.1 restriction endonuclease subunit S [Kocuria rhizophila]BAG28871.1 type I restriction enzyme S protein [Kocuria rhizophila DC2201]VEH75838.1 EcoKI restriction-modification system protein HsdS [Kocuria rhizophila]
MTSKSWKAGTVGEVTHRVTKGTTPTTLGGTFESSGINFVKVESITEAGTLNHSKLAFIDEQTHAMLARSILEQDDLLFSIAGTIGRVARVRPSDLPGNTNQAVAIIRPNPEKVDRDYLYYCLRDTERIARARTRVVQSVQQNLSLAEVSNIELPLPSLPEQRAIAATLGALDDKIESNRRLAERASALIDASASQLLARTSTEVLPLADLVEFNRLSVNPHSTDTLRYIDIASVSSGQIDSVQELTWNEAPSRARRGVSDGDVIYSTVRPGNRAFALIVDPTPGSVASTGFAVMSPSVRLGSSMLTSVVGAHKFAEYLESVAHGSAYPAVGIQAMGNYSVVVPKEAVVAEQFEADTMPLRRRVAQARAESERLAALRDTLLPELLSGRVRAPIEGDPA